MRKDFLYFFVDALGRCFRQNPNGSVDTTPIKTPLKSTPDGWQEVSIKFGRNIRFPGMFRTFTVPLKAILDGAAILKYLHYVIGGVEAICNLIIQRLNRDTGIHEEYYVGEMDFSQFSDADYGATINVMEGGLSKMVKANENTVYEIPIDVPEAITIDFDGIELYSSVRILNYQDAGGSTGGRNRTYCNIGLIVTPSETTYPSLLFNSTTQYNDNDSLDPVGNWSDIWTMKAESDVSFKIENGQLQFILGSHYIKIGFYRVNEITGDSYITTIFEHTYPDGITRFLQIDISGTYDFIAGDRIWLYSEIGTGVAEDIAFVWPQIPPRDPNDYNVLTTTYNYRKPATDVKALRSGYVFEQLIQKISGGKYHGVSNLLASGLPYDTVLTPGDGLRGFKGAVIKTSLNEFIQSMDTPFNVGLGIDDNVASLEKKSAFFINEVGMHIGEVAQLQIQPALDHIYNTIDIGYPNQNYQDVNGRNEFNTLWSATLPILRVVKKLDLQSKYRADPYGAEFTRINLTNKTTTDSTSDNDTFMINIESVASPTTGKYKLNRPHFDSMEGILSPSTIFNILLSVKRCLLEHGDYIHTGLDFQDMNSIVMQTASKNQALVTVNGTERIAEKDPVIIGTLHKKLFRPNIFSFTTQGVDNLMDIITINKYKLVGFTWMGIELNGYIIECGQAPALDAIQEWKFLCGPDVDLSKLYNLI